VDYAAHSPVTDPGQARPWLHDLPRDVRSLAGLVNGLVVHQDRMSPEIRAQGTRADEPRLRHAAAMLDRLRALDASPPTVPRPAPRRLVGHCRSSSVLLCCFLRETGTAARTRSGFSVYYAGGREFYGDHWVTEYRGGPDDGWLLVDAELDDATRAEHDITFDQIDVPRDQWLSAAEAWRRGRRDDDSWRWFGAHPSDVGPDYVAGQLLRDAAGLVREEVGAFDVWVPQPLDPVLPLLDDLARLLLDDPDPVGIRSYLDGHPALRPPPWALAGP
jgi:hypothetical protein